jgi:hypothetical protein
MTSGKRTTNETAQVGERGDGENAGSLAKKLKRGGG